MNRLEGEIKIKELINEVHNIAKSKGWWESPRETGTLLMLMVSELAEAMEADRNILKGEYIELKLSPYFFDEILETLNNAGHGELASRVWTTAKQINPKENFKEELADTVIRIFDYCGAKEIDLEAEILKKVETNKAREYKHGGKSY